MKVAFELYSPRVFERRSKRNAAKVRISQNYVIYEGDLLSFREGPLPTP